MKKLNDYKIHYKGLGLGKHEFDYLLDDDFFKFFDKSDVLGGKVNVKAILSKQSNLLDFKLTINGEVVVPCDRCLDEVSVNVDFEGNIFVKFGISDDETDDGFIILDPNDHEFDLKDYIFDSILLSLPPRKVHNEDENGVSLCNPEMIKKIEELTSNKESAIDSRWNKLRELNK